MKEASSLDHLQDLDFSEIFDLDDAYAKSLKDHQRDDRGGIFHPSGVGMCKRRTYYEYRKEDAIKTISPKSLEIFDLGHAIHELVMSRLSNLHTFMGKRGLGYSISVEKGYDPETDPLFLDLGIGGTADAILEIWADDWKQRSIIEAKSINEKNFEKVLIEGPKKNHVMQAHLYAFRFDCPIIYVWYYCKNNSDRMVFPIIFDYKILEEALAFFQEVSLHVETSTPPTREEDWFSCRDCQYRHICEPPILHSKRAKAENKAMASIRRKGRL